MRQGFLAALGGRTSLQGVDRREADIRHQMIGRGREARPDHTLSLEAGRADEARPGVGQVRGETTAMCRSWVEGELCTFPASITKNKLEHTVPLPALALELLAKIPITGDAYFPASRTHVRGKPTTTFNGWSRAKEEFDGRISVAPYTLHSLRKSFATSLAGLQVAPHVVEALLNHRMGTLRQGGIITAVAAVYNKHQYLEEKRQAMALWNTHLLQILAR